MFGGGAKNITKIQVVIITDFNTQGKCVMDDSHKRCK